MAYEPVQYIASGVVSNFTIPFSYISSGHIKAYLNEELQAASAYTFPSPTVLQFNAPPPAGARVRIERVTPIDDRLVTFANGVVLQDEALNVDSEQALFALQEIREDGGGIGPDDIIDGGTW